ncbi:uncharacterized protein LOC128557860 isoform X1 [Mercenaria mercenaria]|uniref:uncharacterized protein LOC128557860 isoform X1 n=1 Tax=Mercenaria mercenaria TaxID=6596 RepID=UPI00234EFD52|nr:uncharacterized protein LOC128557860 isoform X1 [Mercenaria mercenaria]
MFNCKSVSDKQERDAIMERIKKKENELQDICSYIDLIETERELDEKIIKANDIKSFLSETSTARRADYEKEAGIYLTRDDLEEAFREKDLDEDGKRLFRFAMRTISDETIKSKMCEVELTVYLAHNSKITISKGAPKQKIVILLDEKNEPILLGN